jgi:hypothetical protein
MPTATYTALANITLGSTSALITFSSIPATYRDLVMTFTGTASTTAVARMRFNSDTGANYSFQNMRGSGTAAAASSSTGSLLVNASVGASATTTSALQLQVNIMEYSATNKHKMVLSRADNTAINSIQVFPASGTWAIGTTVNLYGIVN